MSIGNIGSGPQLRMTDNTTLAEVNKFLKENGAKDGQEKLRAYKDNGETILYISQPKGERNQVSTFFNKLFFNISGKAEERRSLAGDALRDVIDRFSLTTENDTKLPTDAKTGLNTMLQGIKPALQDRASALRVGEAVSFFVTAEKLATGAKDRAPRKANFTPIDTSPVKSMATLGLGADNVDLKKLVSNFKEDIAKFKTSEDQVSLNQLKSQFKNLNSERDEVGSKISVLEKEIMRLSEKYNGIEDKDSGIANELDNLIQKRKFTKEELSSQEKEIYKNINLTNAEIGPQNTKVASNFSKLVTAHADKMSEIIGPAIDKLNLDPSQRSELKFSFNTGAIEDLARLLLDSAKPNGGDLSYDDIKTLAQKTFDQSVATVTGDRSVPTEPTRLLFKNVPYEMETVEIGGKQYEPKSILGQGGFGMVVKYQEKEGSAEIVLKVPVLNATYSKEQLQLDVQGEIANFKHLEKAGNESSVKMIGAPRLSNGQVAIALELAPHGDVQGFGHKLVDRIATNTEDVPSGKITQAEAKLIRLTLFQDMTKALDEFHRESDMTHYDFKPGNVLINQSGRGILADFGGSFAGSEGVLVDRIGIDSAYYKSPEQLFSSDSFKNIGKNEVEPQFKLVRNEVMDDLKTIFADTDDETLGIVVENILSGVQNDMQKTANRSVTIDNKVDIWALGASAVELFTGNVIVFDDGIGSEFAFKDQDKIERALKQDNFIAITPDVEVRPENSLATSTGDKNVDSLINAIMVKEPLDRPSATRILNSDIFTSTPGIGSESVRKLIVALASGDNEKIDLARQALKNSLVN